MVIGLCAFNRGKRIIPTLDALAAQERPRDEDGRRRITRVLICDNNSSDDTRRVIEQFIEANPDADMSLVVESEPGKRSAIKRLFSETEKTGEQVVLLIDDDCVPQRGWAAGLLAAIDACPRAGIVGGRIDVEFESGPTPVARRYLSTFGPQHLGERLTRLDAPDAFLGGASQAIRRRAMRDSGWLEDGRLTCLRGDKPSGGEDVELCYMVRDAGWELWYEPGAPLRHIIPSERQTLAYITRVRESMGRVEPWHRWMSQGRPVGPSGAEWAESHLKRVEQRLRKTRLLEWRPIRRAIRLAERRGRLEGWRNVRDHLLRPEGGARP